MSLNFYLFLRFFVSILFISILKPQTPEWNPLIIVLRKKFERFCPTYGIAKQTLTKITWNSILSFYVVIFYYLIF